MIDLASLFAGLVVAWGDLPLEPLQRGFIHTLALGLFFFSIIYAIERAYDTRTHYRSRLFLHDVAYWFYYRLGLNRLLLFAPVVAFLEQPLSLLDLELLKGLPFAVQIFLFYLLRDFFGYWVHRAQHHFKFLWAFHTTHHSQVYLNFGTTNRFHPLDHFFHEFLMYIPLRILGADPLTWLSLYLLHEFLGLLQHTEIPWRFGPLYKIIVGPMFHAYHHSIDPAHYNRNFGANFGFWDYLFGTAVKDGEPKPTRFGLENVTPVSFWSTLIAPFNLLHGFYVRDR